MDYKEAIDYLCAKLGTTYVVAILSGICAVIAMAYLLYSIYLVFCYFSSPTIYVIEQLLGG